jgi:hypothetical protein
MATYLKDLNGGDHSVLEANFLAARRTGQVKAQLPLGDDFDFGEPVENGVFLLYDMINKEVKKPGVSNPQNVLGLMLHFSVEKEYDNIRPGLNTFAIYKQDGNKYPGTPYPRLFQPHVGDVFTTDAIRISGSDLNAVAAQAAWDAINAGDSHPVDEDGYINCSTTTTGNGIQLTLLEKTTLPNGGQAGKFAVSVVA